MIPTILVADDNLTIQRTAAEVLSEGGLEVVTVANGMAAIKKISSLMPLVVVADVDMPGKDGYEVCEFVKAQPSLFHIRVLLAVSDTDPYDQERGVQVRADGVIKKPFVREELASLVAKSIEQAQLLRPEATACEPPQSDNIQSLDPPAEHVMAPAPEASAKAVDLAASCREDTLSSQESVSSEVEPEASRDVEPVPAPTIERSKAPEALAPQPLSCPTLIDARVNAPALTEFEEYECYQEDFYDPNFSNAVPLSPTLQPLIDPSRALPPAPVSTACISLPFAEPESESWALPASESDPEIALAQTPVSSTLAEEDSHQQLETSEKRESDAVPEPEIFLQDAASGPIAPPLNPFADPIPPESENESVPGSQIDPSLVASVINAVVRRIAPPMLSPEMLRSLECKLTDEILSELSSGARPES